MYHTGSDKGKCGYQRVDQNFPADATVGFIQEENSGSVGSIEAVLSEPANEGMYQNMTLELFDVETEKTTTNHHRKKPEIYLPSATYRQDHTSYN